MEYLTCLQRRSCHRRADLTSDNFTVGNRCTLRGDHNTNAVSVCSKRFIVRGADVCTYLRRTGQCDVEVSDVVDVSSKRTCVRGADVFTYLRCTGQCDVEVADIVDVSSKRACVRGADVCAYLSCSVECASNRRPDRSAIDVCVPLRLLEHPGLVRLCNVHLRALRIERVVHARVVRGMCRLSCRLRRPRRGRELLRLREDNDAPDARADGRTHGRSNASADSRAECHAKHKPYSDVRARRLFRHSRVGRLVVLYVCRLRIERLVLRMCCLKRGVCWIRRRDELLRVWQGCAVVGTDGCARCNGGARYLCAGDVGTNGVLREPLVLE